MEMTEIDIKRGAAIDRIPEACGRVTVGCSDVAGLVQQVINSFGRLRSEHVDLQHTVQALDEDQKRVRMASDEARILSERAMDGLTDGTAMIASSLTEISNLISLVETLVQHVTGFAAAMDQVRSSAMEIDQIAETSNILALNATIEAMRAGEAGRTFAVVANEVKSLASDTRRATEEIGRTIDMLGAEASSVIEKIQNGGLASERAKVNVTTIQNTLKSVGSLLVEVDGQQIDIARNSETISEHVLKVQDVLDSFDEAVIGNEQSLENAHKRMETLEMVASEMFDELVRAGLSPQDSAMVSLAQTNARAIEAAVDAAIANGDVTTAEVFDTTYCPIEGSNPPRFRTRLMGWADRVWRPMLDDVSASHPDILAAACTDMNGYLPTHLSKHSQPPNGDLTHDTQFCRNGRKILDPIDQKAKTSTAPYMMAVYRQEGDGRSYCVVRNVYVPMMIAGRRWGDFELAYVTETPDSNSPNSAWAGTLAPRLPGLLAQS